MGSFTAGQVVLVHFPFSDLSASKLRPALVLANAGRGDWVLNQITSNAYGDPDALELSTTDFALGSLHRQSYLRPGKLFAAHSSLIASTIGELHPKKLTDIRDAIVKLIQSG